MGKVNVGLGWATKMKMVMAELGLMMLGIMRIRVIYNLAYPGEN